MGAHARLPRHCVTKSRGYSTNLGTLRADRAAYRAQQDQPDQADDVAAEDEDEDETGPCCRSGSTSGRAISTPATCS
jgi:hypothetical protein